MQISVFYNLNHHYFRCNYNDCASYCFTPKGHIDKMNRMLIRVINTSYKNSYKKLPFKKTREPLKHIIGLKIVNLGNKMIDKPQHTSRRKNNWYMWRK